MIFAPRRDRLMLASATWCLFAVAGCGGGSPEKIYQTWSSAVQAGNFDGVWECLTPQARGTVLQIMVLDSDLLSAANPGAKQAFETVFKKYGLNPQEPSFAQNRLQVTNAAEYAFDLNNIFRQYEGDLSKLEGSRFQKLNAIWAATARASLAASQSQGTRATAAVQGSIPHTAPNAQVQAVFEKVNGQWLLAELEENSGGGAMAGGPAGAGAAPAAGMPMGAGRVGDVPAGGPPAGAALPPGMPMGDMKAMPADARPGAMPAGAVGVLPANPGGAVPMPADPKNMAAVGALPPGSPNMKVGVDDPPGAMIAMPARPGGPGEPGSVVGAKAMPATPGGAVPGPMAGKPVPGIGKAMPAGPAAIGAGGLMIGRGEGDLKAMPANPTGAGAVSGGDPDGEGAGVRPGLPGAAGIGAGAGGNQTRQPGTIEYAVFTFMEKVAAGNYSDLSEVVTSKARGLLKEIRDGELTEQQKEEFKETFAAATFVEGSAKNNGMSRSLRMRGKQGHTFQLSVGKENGEFKIRELKIQEPAATKDR